MKISQLQVAPRTKTFYETSELSVFFQVHGHLSTTSLMLKTKMKYPYSVANSLFQIMINIRSRFNSKRKKLSISHNKMRKSSCVKTICYSFLSFPISSSFPLWSVFFLSKILIISQQMKFSFLFIYTLKLFIQTIYFKFYYLSNCITLYF